MKTYNTEDGKSFKIINENRTTYGKAPMRSMMKELRSVLNKKEIDILPSLIFFEAYSPGINTAKATCDENDEFDDRTGMDIVSAKLDMKDHLRMARKYDQTLRVMQSTMRKLEDLCNKHLKKARAIEKDLENHYGWRKK